MKASELTTTIRTFVTLPKEEERAGYLTTTRETHEGADEVLWIRLDRTRAMNVETFRGYVTALQELAAKFQGEEDAYAVGKQQELKLREATSKA